MTLPRRRSGLCSSSSPSSSSSLLRPPPPSAPSALPCPPPFPSITFGIDTGGPGVPQVLGQPGTELRGTRGWFCTHRRGGASWGCPPWLCPPGKGGPEGPWGSAPTAGLPEGPRDSALRSFRSCPAAWSLSTGDETGQSIPVPEPHLVLLLPLLLLLQHFLWVAFLPSLRWPQVPVPKGLGCQGLSPVASLQPREPLGEASELRNEAAPCFSVSERKRRCGKL